MEIPSFTKTYHHRSYAAIDPSRPELSAKDKTVIVTGAGEGSIGSTVALSFAKAGARKLALVGRTESTLQKTKETIDQAFPDATVMLFIADISKTESVGTAAHHIRATLGAWDVFVNCAGFFPSLSPLTGADEDEWWTAFELHAKFSLHFAKHFLPKCRPNATYLGTNAGAALVPASYVPKMSAYCASKVAMAKLDEYLAEENPNLRVFSVHPGVVMTPMAKKAMSGGHDLPPTDEPELPANFMVWLASPEADFFRSGSYLWANWDVEEMKARKAEIEANPVLFRIILGGWPFQ